MIKECKVLMWNECNMVVEFNGEKVQMPSTKKNEKSVYIKFDKNRYSIATEDEYKKSLIKHIKKENIGDEG